MSVLWSSITTLSGLIWEYQSTPSLSSPSSTAHQQLAQQTWAPSWCTAGTGHYHRAPGLNERYLCFIFADLVNSSLYGPFHYAHIAICSTLQCWSWAHRNVHCHRQHAATDQGQKHSQRPGFSQTYPHTTQLPSPDGGKKPKIIT